MIKIKIGKGTFTLEKSTEKADYDLLRKKNSKGLGTKVKHVYSFDCALGSANPARPNYFVVGPTLGIFSYSADGKRNKLLERDIGAALANGIGARTSADIEKALFKAIHLHQVKIPWSKLTKSINKSNSKYIVVAWVEHEYVALIPPGKTAKVASLLGCPVRVHYQLIEIGRSKTETAETAETWVVNEVTDVIGYPEKSKLEALMLELPLVNIRINRDEAAKRAKIDTEHHKRDKKRRADYVKKIQKAYRKP